MMMPRFVRDARSPSVDLEREIPQLLREGAANLIHDIVERDELIVNTNARR
jgi:hypothetical protein